MTQAELTKEDEKRIIACDNYKLTKSIMKAHEEYKQLNIGEVYFLKRQRKDGSYQYSSRNYGDHKDKYMIFHKDDEGFVFVKRINASGKLGKEIMCLTTQFHDWELEPDPEFVESIIFANEEGYDPLKAEKEINSKKGKARRRNKKLEVKFEKAQEAFDYISELQAGDVLYDCSTAYGEGVIEWKVVNVEHRKTDKTEKTVGFMNRYVKGNTREDQIHNEQNLDDFVKVEIKAQAIPKSRGSWISPDRTITFNDFYSKYGCVYYDKKPYTLDDV